MNSKDNRDAVPQPSLVKRKAATAIEYSLSGIVADL
jgi:hypothetical protein